MVYINTLRTPAAKALTSLYRLLRPFAARRCDKYMYQNLVHWPNRFGVKFVWTSYYVFFYPEIRLKLHILTLVALDSSFYFLLFSFYLKIRF